MKRSSKIWLTVAAILILSGGIMFVVTMREINWDFTALDSLKYISEATAVEEKFENVSVNANQGNVSFFLSDDKNCHVTFYLPEKIIHETSVRDNTLYVETRDESKWYDRITVFTQTPKISIYLPKAAYASLTAEGDTANIIISNDLTFESIDVSSDTGDVHLEGISAGKIHIETNTGDVHLEGISAESLALTVSSGKTFVRRADFKSKIILTAGTGDATLWDVTCSDLSSVADTGKILMNEVTATGSLSLTRNTGDVNFERCDASEISIETDTGDVTGTLLSEKVFIVHSDTGKISVPETYSGGKCKITTDTGDIAVSIDDNSSEAMVMILPKNRAA